MVKTVTKNEMRDAVIFRLFWTIFTYRTMSGKEPEIISDENCSTADTVVQREVKKIIS